MYFESHINVALRQSVGQTEQEALLGGIRDLARLERMKLTIMDGHDHLPDEKTREIVVTGHAQDQHALERRVKSMIAYLKSNGHRVTRYKIEQALVDSRVVDDWGLLDA